MEMKHWQPRSSRPDDAAELQALWAMAFGDSPEFIADYFARFFAPGSAVVLERDGHIISAAHRLPSGGLRLPEGEILPVCTAYAFATAPAYRGNGFGAIVLKEAIRLDFAEGFTATVLHPAEERLFDYYARHFGYRNCFYVREASLDLTHLPVPKGSICYASPQDYNDFRNQFLRGRLYLMQSDAGIRYQAHLCDSTGGGLYLLTGEDFLGCAACEKGEDGTVLVKELLCPPGKAWPAVAMLASAVSGRRWEIRTPADLTGSELGGHVKPFGQMICRGGDSRSIPDECRGYYGFAFD